MVSPAITAALIAAASQEEVEQKIEGRLKKAGAISIARAVALDLEGKDQKLLNQALASGSVKRTNDGRLYLDERVISERNEGQAFMVLLILLVVGSVIASAIALASQAGN